jgi:hypothetical protein
LTWLARRAVEKGAHEPALTYARAAWEAAPSVERYLLLRALDGAAESRSDLLRSLETKADKSLLIEILTAEGKWEEAAALLPESGFRRAELTESLARAVSDEEPEQAIELLFDLAALHAGSPTGYSRAIQAVLAAQTVAESQSIQSAFAFLLQKFKIDHRRKSKLLRVLVENGID